MAPSAYTSARGSTGRPAACSGDMYEGVPTTAPAAVSPAPLPASRGEGDPETTGAAVSVAPLPASWGEGDPETAAAFSASRDERESGSDPPLPLAGEGRPLSAACARRSLARPQSTTTVSPNAP